MRAAKAGYLYLYRPIYIGSSAPREQLQVAQYPNQPRGHASNLYLCLYTYLFIADLTYAYLYMYTL